MPSLTYPLSLRAVQFSSLRFALKKILRSLRLVDEVVWDGYGEDTVLKAELLNILSEAEEEIGALLRSQSSRLRTKSHHHQQGITSLLIRLAVTKQDSHCEIICGWLCQGYKDELRPETALPRMNSFRIPLFTRCEQSESVLL